MRKLASVVVSLVVSVSIAEAQIQRTFVSASGNDANPCSRPMPCRNFGAALTAAMDGGEVVVLDSAGYGALSITKGISIVVPRGVYGGITAFSGAAISVNAPATAIVTLRGLTLTGEGAGKGIDASAVGALHIENCAISGFVQDGVSITTATSSLLFIEDSIVRDSGTGAYIAPSAGGVTGGIVNSRFEANGNLSGITSLATSAPVNLTIRDSVFLKNGNAIDVYGSDVVLQNCTVANNQGGINEGFNGTVAFSGTMFAGNSLAVSADVGAAKSFGNNQFINNAGDGTFGSIAQK